MNLPDSRMYRRLHSQWRTYRFVRRPICCSMRWPTWTSRAPHRTSGPCTTSGRPASVGTIVSAESPGRCNHFVWSYYYPTYFHSLSIGRFFAAEKTCALTCTCTTRTTSSAHSHPLQPANCAPVLRQMSIVVFANCPQKPNTNRQRTHESAVDTVQALLSVHEHGYNYTVVNAAESARLSRV